MLSKIGLLKLIQYYNGNISLPQVTTSSLEDEVPQRDFKFDFYKNYLYLSFYFYHTYHNCILEDYDLVLLILEPYIIGII